MDPFQELWGPPQGSNAGPLTMQLLKQFEGFAPVAKWDVRQYSGGYGSRAQPGERFTPELAEQRLSQDVAPVNSWLDKNITQQLTPERRAAFNSFGYNLGVDDLEKLKPDINRGDWATVGNRMLSFNKAGGEVNPGLVNRRKQEAAMVMGGLMPAFDADRRPRSENAAQESKPMPMMQPPGFPQPQPQPQGPLTSAMGGLPDSMVPSIFGGSDQQGYFGRLLSDPTFLMGTSVLGAGLSGRDAGTALTQGAQAANATSDLAARRNRAMAWQKIMGGPKGPDTNSPLLKGMPAEVLPVIQSMGPEDGMKLLHQFAMQRLAPDAVGEVGPGGTVYNKRTMRPMFTAPSESPYAKELGIAQAKADVKQGQSSKAGQQMLDLTDRMIALAGEPGTPQRQTFSDATGPIQGTSLYQGIKGFVNSKAETPQIYRNLQQDLGTIKLLASRAYLSGEGQVSDNERKMIADAVGNVETAPSGEAALQAMQNLKEIVHQVFMKPAAQSGPPAQPGAPAPQGMPQDVAMPGMSVAGGVPGAPPPQDAPQGQPAPQGSPTPGPQGGAMVTATGPNGEKVQLDPASGQWQPVQAPPAGQAGPAAAAPAAPIDKGPFSAPRPNGPNILDKWVLKAGAERKPELIQQYDAAYGPGEAAKVLGGGKPPAQGAPLGMGRGSYMGAR